MGNVVSAATWRTMFVFTVFLDGFHLLSPLKEVKDIGNIMIGNVISKSLNAFKALLSRTVSIECDSIPYEFRDVPLKRILNWIRVETSIQLRAKSPWGWPTHLQIEPATLCNLRCALCPVTEGMDRHTGLMELDLFKKYIDEVGEYVFLALMWDWGEPFVNPSIYDMIAYAKEKGIKVVSSTNGHFLAKEENARRLISSGIDTIIIAMDGITQHTYERYRQSGNLATVLEGIRNVIAQKQTLNSETPLINLRFLAMKHNEHEIPELKRLAKSLGVDVLSIKTLNPYSRDTYFEHRAAQGEDYDAFLPEEASYRRFRYVGNKHRHRVRRNPPCKNLWNAPSIHWNGIVCPCTYDYNEMYIFGDLKSDTFEDVWFGLPYREMRRQFRSDWEKIRLCCNCSYAYEGGSCWNETIAKVFFNPKIANVFSKPEDPDKVQSLDDPE
jgi:MoaA/NifB/PqqE/SkfB family radical SAM enzyme